MPFDDDLDLPAASELSFAEAMDWLEARVGEEVVASFSGAGTSGAHLRGVLGPGDGELQLVDRPAGELVSWAVGPAALVLAEGELRAAEVIDEGALALDLGDTQLVVAVLAGVDAPAEWASGLTHEQLVTLAEGAGRDAELRRLAMLCIARLGLGGEVDEAGLVAYVADVGAGGQVPTPWPGEDLPEADGLWVSVVAREPAIVVRLVDVLDGGHRALRFDGLGRITGEGSGARLRFGDDEA